MILKFLTMCMIGMVLWGKDSFAGKHPRPLDGVTHKRNIRIHGDRGEDIGPAVAASISERKRSYEEKVPVSRNIRHHGPEVPQVLPEHKDFLQAFRRMRVEDPEGHYEMGLLQIEGKGHQNTEVAQEMAKNLFAKAAQKGHAEAARMVGYMELLEGANAGNPEAQYQLALWHLRKDPYQESNQKNALSLFEQAAYGGNEKAQRSLYLLKSTPSNPFFQNHTWWVLSRGDLEITEGNTSRSIATQAEEEVPKWVFLEIKRSLGSEIQFAYIEKLIFCWAHMQAILDHSHIG